MGWFSSIGSIGSIHLVCMTFSMQLPRGDVVEQGEGDGHPPVEGGGGDSHLAAGRAAGRPRGAGLRHAGDSVQRQQAARVHAASGAERQLHEGERQSHAKVARLHTWLELSKMKSAHHTQIMHMHF